MRNPYRKNKNNGWSIQKNKKGIYHEVNSVSILYGPRNIVSVKRIDSNIGTLFAHSNKSNVVPSRSLATTKKTS